MRKAGSTRRILIFVLAYTFAVLAGLSGLLEAIFAGLYCNNYAPCMRVAQTKAATILLLGVLVVVLAHLVARRWRA